MKGQLLSLRTLLPSRDKHGRLMKDIPVSHRSDSLLSAVGPQGGVTNIRAGTGEVEKVRGETMFYFKSPGSQVWQTVKELYPPCHPPPYFDFDKSFLCLQAVIHATGKWQLSIINTGWGMFEK